MRLAAYGSLAVLLVLSPACKKKHTESPTKEETPPASPSIPAPDDLLLEAVVKDADEFALRAAKAAGFEKEVGADPYETLTKLAKVDASIARAIDPHGAAAVIVLANPDALLGALSSAAKVERVIHVVGAVHLKDAEAIHALVAAIGKAKSRPARSFDGTIYSIDEKAAWAVTGDVGLVSDDVEVLERAGAYASQLAGRGKKETHDLALRVPMAVWKDKASEALRRAWNDAKGAADAPKLVVAAIDSRMPAILSALGDVGDGSAYLDVKESELVIGASLAAHDKMGAWLGSLPTSSSASLLPAPKGESVSSVHIPGGLGEIVDALIDDGIVAWRPSTASTAEAASLGDVAKALHALRPTFADEATLSIVQFKPAESGEFVIGARLVDGKGAKAAMQQLGVALGGVLAKAIDVTPYTHGSGVGETWTFGVGTGTKPAVTAAWAIADDRLWFDLCNRCVVGAMEATLDGKETLADEPHAKATLASMPTKDVLVASYVDWGAIASGLVGSSGKEAAITGTSGSWGAILTRPSGIDVEWAMPIDVLGGLARAGVQRYLLHSKTAEATRSLGAIETGMKMYAASASPPRFPRSAPAVPTTIPAGMKVMSSPGDWSGSWADVKFRVSDPQYYQYEFVTAPDGQSTAIYARGDLDGDGVTSEFRLAMRIDRTTHEAVRDGFTIAREDE